MKMSVHGAHQFSQKKTGQIDNGPANEITEIDDLFIKSMYFEKSGAMNDPHKHNFDHLTFLASGSCFGIIDGVKEKYYAPAIIFTPAKALHQFIALEDNTALHCINVLHNGLPVTIRD